MLSAVAYGCLALVTVCYLSDWLFSLGDDPEEPVRVKPRVPLIGHLLGLIKSGTKYFTKISAEQHSEVYTLGIFNFKIYVINSRRLIPLVQKSSKTLSFTPFQQFAAKVYVDCSDYTVELHGNPDFMRDFDRATRAALSPGTQLDYQNLRAVNSLFGSVEKLLSRGSVDKPVRVRFYDWSRHSITLAASDGIYGDSNPFLDRKIEDAYWTWNDGVPTLVAGLGVFARKALKARQEVIDSFKQYLNGSYEDAADITKERVRVMSKYGMPVDDIARMQSSFNVALLSNTAPTTFWTLYNIFSRPALLQELRTELEANAISSHKPQDRGGESEFSLDVSAIKTECTLLLSIFEETQRSETIHANIRKVLEDTKLDNKYILKKGNYVQIPNAPIHHDGGIWGPDASDFNPRRFVKNDNAPALASSLPSHAFLAWGTAPHLCPARQFASTEILVMVSLLVLRMEIEPVGGKWERPEPSLGDLVTVLPPKRDVEVEVRAREGWNGVWKAKMGDSKSRVPLASG